MNHFKLIILTMSSLIIISCEKDDICPDSTQTTPQLVVAFYDALDPQQSKNSRIFSSLCNKRF